VISDVPGQRTPAASGWLTEPFVIAARRSSYSGSSLAVRSARLGAMEGYMFSRSMPAAVSVALSATLSCVQLVIPTVAAAQTVEQLTPHRVKLEPVDYRGKRAVKIVEDGNVQNGEAYAVLKNTDFHDGTIEVELAGRPGTNAGPDARGFIGVAFRLRDGRFEYIYLRPTNGRADDQVRRNHSTQYSSFPDFDFARLRKEAPEKYESYVDLEPGAWTHCRIVVQGTTARLFVHVAEQPALVVSDLKLGDSTGSVALWIGPGTEGYFTGLTVRPK